MKWGLAFDNLFGDEKLKKKKEKKYSFSKIEEAVIQQ